MIFIFFCRRIWTEDNETEQIRRKTSKYKKIEINQTKKTFELLNSLSSIFFFTIVYFKTSKMNILKNIFLLKGLIRCIFLIKKIFILLLFRFFFSVILFATCENFFVESNSKKKPIKFNLIISRFFETWRNFNYSF